MLAEYFRRETASLADRCLSDVKTLDDWTSRRPELKRELAEMLGLDPLPERGDLKAVVTGRVDLPEHPEFHAEKIAFQSLPGLYVTATLYVPNHLEKPAPAILYVCGHGNVKKDGISYGSKTVYQHHGAWFARHGYVCLVIDTNELAEIEGNHHGTYRDGLWWWNSRGYTPAGVEAWNGMRALDYLETRPEVDRERFGITGRSGGGAYSWWIAALDERIKAAVPVAGITDLQNHVVDGCVTGHCDCMYVVNTYRWDYPQVAALVAPRPLLISNSDKDGIFPLDGVLRVHAKVRRLYQLYGAEKQLGLLVTEGPHQDSQDLQVPAFRWFNRFLKQEDPVIETAAVKLFHPEQLRVMTERPADERNTKIAESFVPPAPAPEPPDSAAAWNTERDRILRALREKTFRGWPADGAPLDLRPASVSEHDGILLRMYDFTSQENVPLRLYVAHRAGLDKPDLAVLNVLDDAGWASWLGGMRPGFGAELAAEVTELTTTVGPNPPAPDARAYEETRRTFQQFKWVMAYVAPRGVGPAAFDHSEPARTHIRRRYALLGQTLDGMRVWDTRRGVQALRAALTGPMSGIPIWLQGEREMSGIALYASLFEPGIARLDLWNLPRSHQAGPELLNVLKILDMPQAVALAAERTRVKIYQPTPGGWEYPTSIAKKLGWDPKQLDVRVVPTPKP